MVPPNIRNAIYCSLTTTSIAGISRDVHANMLPSLEVRLRSNNFFSIYLISAAKSTMTAFLIISSVKVLFHLRVTVHVPHSVATNVKTHVIVHYRNDLCVLNTLYRNSRTPRFRTAGQCIQTGT
jgi:hypothetical protein